MSSDSEDDELLQRALREQDQIAAKPPPPPFLNDSRKNKKPSRGGADDDDDSDLEILSISSGDEDQSSKDNAARNNRGRGPASRKGGGGERDADRGATDDEPSCWKRVDETEVCASYERNSAVCSVSCAWMKIKMVYSSGGPHLLIKCRTFLCYTQCSKYRYRAMYCNLGIQIRIGYRTGYIVCIA
ncbi:exocyst complex component SEC5B-like [Magnolia sinica]|uniref:exocyst complex component SEC5B-like n=1 Tax=Magnolia sinica TaxID=86752 RepID=UPI002658E986|nr:exocyst complex component SEC5B-like [Magnolia sinica]